MESAAAVFAVLTIPSINSSGGGPSEVRTSLIADKATVCLGVGVVEVDVIRPFCAENVSD